jgi:hypothetical protein
MANVLKNLLSGYGYNLVALQTTGIQPLLLLYKKQDSLGSLDSTLPKLFGTGNKALPSVMKDIAVASIEGSAALSFDAEGGITMLDWLLKKLHMGKLSGNAQFDAGNTVTISYQNVTEDKVDLLELDNYISESVPRTEKLSTYREKLEEGELYVVNAVLKSNMFSVAVTDKNGQHVDVEATVKGIVDAKVDVTLEKNNSITLKHGGETPVVFGFKAQQIIYDKKRWWQFGRKDEALFRIRDQQGEVLKGESDLPTRPLEMGEEMVMLETGEAIAER